MIRGMMKSRARTVTLPGGRHLASCCQNQLFNLLYKLVPTILNSCSSCFTGMCLYIAPLIILPYFKEMKWRKEAVNKFRIFLKNFKVAE
ncbi:hypothetical protein OROGR_027584 [Orobanche gracilis]